MIFREFLRAATKIRPHIVLDTIKSGEALAVKEGVKLPIKGTCKKCDYISSQEYCKEPLFYVQRKNEIRNRYRSEVCIQNITASGLYDVGRIKYRKTPSWYWKSKSS